MNTKATMIAAILLLAAAGVWGGQQPEERTVYPAPNSKRFTCRETMNDGSVREKPAVVFSTGLVVCGYEREIPDAALDATGLAITGK
jgi:hypothetical protein